MSRRDGSIVPAEQVKAVVDATRVLGGLIAESLAEVEPPITMPQWRVLVLAAEGPCNVSAVAGDLGVHPSNATRVCDRLVSAGLLSRQKAAADRRQVLLTLTPAGRQLFDTAMEHRRGRVQDAMARMSAEHRSGLAASIAAFAEAALAVHVERGSDEG